MEFIIFIIDENVHLRQGLEFCNGIGIRDEGQTRISTNYRLYIVSSHFVSEVSQYSKHRASSQNTGECIKRRNNDNVSVITNEGMQLDKK